MHADAYEKINGLELVAIADMNEKKGQQTADRFNCIYYKDAEDMLNKEAIDMIDVCLPTFLHEQYVLLAAKFKKHVLCEKPFALSEAACERMIAACESAGIKFMIAQTARWWPDFIEIKRLIDTNKLGDLHIIYGNRLAQHPNWTSWHRDPKKSGGGLFDLHSHDIDYLFYLFGPVEKVFATGWKNPGGCWNHVISTLIFKNGVKVVEEGSLEMNGDYPFSIALRLMGDNGTIDYHFSAGFNIRNTEKKSDLYFFDKSKEIEKLEVYEFDAYEAEIAAFTDSIINDTPVPIPPKDSLYVIKIIKAIQNSLESGDIVCV